MISALNSHLVDVSALCRRYGVGRLELFGSAITDMFDLLRSDLDFLVDFTNTDDLFHRYFGLKEALEVLLGRKVDLVMIGAMTNKHFIEAVNKTRRIIYAAENTETA